MTVFTKALKHTLKWEGGDKITRDPHDPGGTTKYGIAQRFHPNVDVVNLTLQQAEEIYLKEYWLPLNCAAIEIISPVLAAKVFDIGVNLGVRRAAKLFQQAIQTMSPGLAIDGRIGSATLTALSALDIPTVQALLQERLEAHYRAIGNERFERGWLNRAASWPDLT